MLSLLCTWRCKLGGRRVAMGDTGGENEKKTDRYRKSTPCKDPSLCALDHEFTGFRGCYFMFIKTWIWGWWDGSLGDISRNHIMEGEHYLPSCLGPPHMKCLWAQ